MSGPEIVSQPLATATAVSMVPVTSAGQQERRETSAAADSLSPPVPVWTPAGRRQSSQRVADQLLPSSPLLKDSSQTPVRPGGDLTPGSRGSSERFSKTLEELRWDGGSIRDNDSIFRQSIGNQSTLGPETGNRTDLDTDQETAGAQSDTQEGPSSYSVLSKRADFILENAKRKLNLLEGNLGRARHSLLIPPTNSLDFRSFSPSTDKPTTPLSSDEERTRVPLSRLNFAPSRDSKIPPSQRFTMGHNRMFSDGSVPSDRGVAIKGSRGIEQIQQNIPRRALEKPYNELGRDSSALDTVQEDGETPQNGQRRQVSGGSRAAKDLRAQAEELRTRISFLQARSKDDSDKRRSLRVESGMSREFSEQVAALKDSLEEQEKVINELEHQEQQQVVIPPKDTRAEWRQILEQNDADDGDEDSYSDESSSYPSGDEFQLLDDELMMPEEQEETLDGAHEDRVDAFDYEHFILHSVMGNHVRRASEASSTSISTEKANEDGSASGERAISEPYDEDEDLPEVPQRPRMLPTESSATMTTVDSFVTAATEREEDDDDEEDDEDSSSDGPETSSVTGESWPVPPTSTNGITSPRSSTSTSTTKVASKHSSSATASKSSSFAASRRPASLIVSHLTRPMSSSESVAALKEEDKALMYSCAESFRTVCMKLQRSDLGPHDGVDLRQRLEIAKRVLNGDL